MNDSPSRYQKFLEYEQEKDPCSVIENLYPHSAKNRAGTLNDLFSSSNHPAYNPENWILFVRSPTYCRSFVLDFLNNKHKYSDGFPSFSTFLTKWLEYSLENPKLAIQYFIFIENQKGSGLNIPKEIEKDLEIIISKDGFCSYIYAKDILKNRFKLGEESIFKDPEDTIKYLTDVVCKSMNNSHINVPGDMVDSVEECVCKDPVNAFKYAKLTNKRFEKGEPAISQDAESSFYYAKYILKSRFELGEKSISKVSDLLFKYATSVVGGKLPEKMHKAMELHSFSKV